jgi:hypothetical protein
VCFRDGGGVFAAEEGGRDGRVGRGGEEVEEVKVET